MASAQNGAAGMNMSCAIAFAPAAPMPNQRAQELPLSSANDAQTSTTPRRRTIHPQVRRALKTYVAFGAYTLLFARANAPSRMFQPPAKPSMIAANATQPDARSLTSSAG